MLTPNYFQASAAGTIPAGMASIEVTNTGGAAGTLCGNTFPAGATVKWQVPSPAGERMNSVAYNATGTTFDISTLV